MSSLPTVKFPFHQVHGTRHLLPHHVPPSTSSHLPLRRPCLLLAASVSTSRPCRICKLFFFFLYFFSTNNLFAFPASPCPALREPVSRSASPRPATYVPMSRPHITPSVSPRHACHALSLSYLCVLASLPRHSLVLVPMCRPPSPSPPSASPRHNPCVPHITTPAFPTSQPLRSPCHPLHPRVMPPVSRRPRPLNTSTPGSSTPMLPVPHPHPCPS